MNIKSKLCVIEDFMPYALAYKEKLDLNPYKDISTGDQSFIQAFESPEALAEQEARNQMCNYLETLKIEELRFLYVMMYIGRDESLKPDQTLDNLYIEMDEYLSNKNNKDGMVYSLSSKGSNVIDYLLEAKSMI